MRTVVVRAFASEPPGEYIEVRFGRVTEEQAETVSDGAPEQVTEAFRLLFGRNPDRVKLHNPWVSRPEEDAGLGGNNGHIR